MRELADGIYSIGSQAFPSIPERLFAYGLGDGFLVVPDYSPQTVEKPLAIAMLLMQQVLLNGGTAKAAISRGETADVSGWFSDPVRNQTMGRGLIMTYPIMGSALINPFNLGREHSGSVLILDPSFVDEFPDGVELDRSNPPLVDWIHSDFPLLIDVARASGLFRLPPDDLAQRLTNYIESQNGLSAEWIRNTLQSTNLNQT